MFSYLPYRDSTAYNPFYSSSPYHQYGYPTISPRERAYLLARQRQEAIERERERLYMEELRKEELARQFLAQRRAQQYEAWLASQGMMDKEEEVKEPDMEINEQEPAPISPVAEKQQISEEELQEARENAAVKIQSTYRTYKSLASIRSIQSDFNGLVQSFTLPSSIDFTLNGETISVGEFPESSDSVGEQPYKLAYTNTNKPIHLFNESINRLLVKLDSVESFGVKAVRDTRRALAKEMEGAASQLDSRIQQIWANYLSPKKPEEVDVTNESQSEEDISWLLELPYAEDVEMDEVESILAPSCEEQS